MPGENCAIFGCSTSRRHKGISIFKVPLPNNEFNKKWNRDLINIITKERQVDEPLKKRIVSCNLYICERHFSREQIWKYPFRKVLKDGALPSLNLPEKVLLHQNHHTITRPTSSIQKREEHLESATLSPPPPSYIYKEFQDFKDRTIKLSLNDLWQFELSENLVIATFKSTNHVLPKFEVFIDNTLTFSLRVYGWVLPQNHELYSKFNKSFHNVTFSNFVAYVRQFIPYKGISTGRLNNITFFNKM